MNQHHVITDEQLAKRPHDVLVVDPFPIASQVLGLRYLLSATDTLV